MNDAYGLFEKYRSGQTSAKNTSAAIDVAVRSIRRVPRNGAPKALRERLSTFITDLNQLGAAVATDSEPKVAKAFTTFNEASAAILGYCGD